MASSPPNDSKPPVPTALERLTATVEKLVADEARLAARFDAPPKGRPNLTLIQGGRDD